MPLSLRTRQGIQRSRLFVCLVTPAWLTDAEAQAQSTYARHLGKPFRVLVAPDVHLPEDAFLGVTDLRLAPLGTPEEATAQIRAWIEELRAKEATPC